MRRLHFVVGLLAVLGSGGYWVLTAPFRWAAIYTTLDDADDAKPDLVNGRTMFFAGGRGTCHAPPGQQEATRLDSGLALVLGAIVADKRFSGAPDPDGSSYVPGVAADDTGIGYGSRREIADDLGDAVCPIGIPADGSMAAIVADTPISPDDRSVMAQSITRIAGIDAPNAGAPEPNLTALVKMLPLASNVAKSPSNALAQSADALSRASVVYTVATKPLFLDRASVSAAGSGDGRILPAAKLTVVARDGDWLRVRIDGWQLQGSEAAFEALEGQRILVAALSRAAIAKVASQPGVVDAATKLTWFQGALTAWVSTEGLTTDIDKIWKYDGVLYAASCGTCHAPRPIDGYTSDRWLTDLERMKRFTDLRGDQYRLLEVYLQYHSKDVGLLIAGGER
jgi:hypothetical protein